MMTPVEDDTRKAINILIDINIKDSNNRLLDDIVGKVKARCINKSPECLCAYCEIATLIKEFHNRTP